MIFLSPLVLALAVMIKGGWIGKYIWKSVPSYVNNILPAMLVGIFMTMSVGIVVGVFTSIATLVFNLSLGEEIGAVINNIGRNQYIDNDDFGREFGVKKALQRGITDGAAFTVATWNPLMLFAGLLFVPVYWSMSKLKHRFTGVNDWEWAEPMYGFVFGVFLLLVFI